MGKWEYAVIYRDMTDSLFRKRLTKMGEAGWELVTVVEQEVWTDFNHTTEKPTISAIRLMAYMKRPKI